MLLLEFYAIVCSFLISCEYNYLCLFVYQDV